MKAEEFYKQRSNSIRELWALSPKQIEYIALIMEEYVALRQPLVSGMLKCASCENTAKKDGLDCYGKCHICTQAF